MTEFRPISKVILERITADQNGRSNKFFSSQNISRFIEEGEIEQLLDEVTVRVQDLLNSLIIDTENDHNTKDTARRVAKMFVLETFGGRYRDAPKITAFPNVGSDENPYEGLYLTGPIEIRSTCAHHLQNITGKCWIGVVPKENVIGLSKFNRIVEHIASRPQIQEEMTMQIADALSELCATEDVAVLVKGEHHCMSHRGVKAHSPSFSTPVLRGEFFKGRLRREFYDLVALHVNDRST